MLKDFIEKRKVALSKMLFAYYEAVMYDTGNDAEKFEKRALDWLEQTIFDAFIEVNQASFIHTGDPVNPQAGTPEGESDTGLSDAIMEELKPCPFCGHQAHIVEERKNEFKVYCGTIGCVILPALSGCFTSKNNAIKQWNKRIIASQEGS